MNPDQHSQNVDALKLEFLQLVRHSRQFIESKSPKKISRNALIAHPKQEAKPVEIEIPKPSVEQLPKIQPKKEIKATNWELHPMPPNEDQTPFKQKLSTHCPTCDLNIPVKFLLPKENSQDRLFLENVSRVVTRTYAPACVLLFKEQLFQDPHTTYLFAPIVLLQKRFEDVSPHKSFSHKGLTILPMDSLENYSQDTNCKRALWSAIQHLFQS